MPEIPAAWSWGIGGNLQDDGNRFLAAIAARKCTKRGQPAKESTGAEYPLWVKIEKDIPFIEFMISDALTKAGLHYDRSMGSDTNAEPLASFIEKAREVLNKNPIKGLKLVPEKTYFMQINDGNLCTFNG